MKRVQISLLAVAFAICVLGAGCGDQAVPGPGPVKPATAGPAQWTATYAADLTGGRPIGDDWWMPSGAVSLADGKLVIAGNRRGRLEGYIYGYRFPGSVRLEMTGSVNTRNPTINLDLWLNADAPEGTFTFRGYAFQIRSGGVTLRRDEKAIASQNFAWEKDKTYSVVAEQNEGRVSLTVDGVTLISVADNRPLESRSMDMVGFSGYGAGLNLQKLAVFTRLDRPADAITPPAPPTSGPEITIIGPAQCARACTDKPGQVDHDVVVLAMDGDPKVKAKFDEIMDKFYPAIGLNLDDAKKLLEQFDRHLCYYLMPCPMTKDLHAEVSYPSWMVKVTGRLVERDGKRWIYPAKIETAGQGQPPLFIYPARMLEADQPFVRPEGQPLVLKVTDTLSLKCIKIPAGEFLDGSPLYEHPRWQDEFPHEVVITKPLYWAEIPVTQEMFQAVVGKNPSPNKGPQFAVENPTWDDINLFCQKLSELNGRKVRLPTDGEWEWAARVGTSNPCFSQRYKDQISFVGDKEGRDEPVRRHAPSAWGLYDMVKSGWELVSDYKSDNVRDKQIDPQGPPRSASPDHGSGVLRRAKGGLYRGNDYHLNMHGAVDSKGSGEEGIVIFRVVAEDAPPTTAPALN
jgi:formylglycine-generating enzyme required for sulfatase activity